MTYLHDRLGWRFPNWRPHHVFWAAARSAAGAGLAATFRAAAGQWPVSPRVLRSAQLDRVGVLPVATGNRRARPSSTPPGPRIRAGDRHRPAGPIDWIGHRHSPGRRPAGPGSPRLRPRTVGRGPGAVGEAVVLTLPPSTRVFVATGPTDMRRS